jgi:iron(III) transport system substrate-binding protein
MMRYAKRILAPLAAVATLTGASVAAVAHSGHDANEKNTTITIYSGRSESLVGPILERFEEKTGHDVQVRYGGTAELAGLLLEEGSRTPADVFFAQDAGALGALAKADRLNTIPTSILTRVDEKYRSPVGVWVGVTGRARTIVYDTNKLSADDMPDSILDFTDPKWKGRIAWAPSNGSFQAHVTAMRVQLGDARTRAWLEGILANEPREYPKNSAIVRAVGAAEAEVGFVNHYYLSRFKAEDPDFPAANHYTESGDPGSLVNVAGVALLRKSPHNESKHRAAIELFEFLLSEDGQSYFAKETKEYPLIESIESSKGLVPIEEIDPPDIDLSDLDDLKGTLEMLREVGALP